MKHGTVSSVPYVSFVYPSHESKAPLTSVADRTAIRRWIGERSATIKLATVRLVTIATVTPVHWAVLVLSILRLVVARVQRRRFHATRCYMLSYTFWTDAPLRFCVRTGQSPRQANRMIGHEEIAKGLASWMTMTARMILVFLVALINLGLGFAAAVHAGRGPWSRYARRYAGTSRIAPQAEKSVEQIAKELEGLEKRLQELLQRFSEQPADKASLEELRSIIRNMSLQVESLGTDESQEYHEQASTGLRKLSVVLKTATTELGRALESDEPGSLDPVPLLTNLQMACREVSILFNALLFAELPT